MKKEVKKLCGCIFVILFGMAVLLPEKEIYAKEQESIIEEILEDTGITFEDIENSINSTSIGERISFEEIIRLLCSGDLELAFKKIWDEIKDILLGELCQNRRNFIQIVLLVLLAAIFTNIGTGVFSASLQQTGFYVIYIAVAGIVIQSFFFMFSITNNVLGEIFSFIEVFIPVYAMSITLVSGSGTSIALYEMTFLLVKGCQWVLKVILLPLIEAYMMIELINCVSETDRFSYFGKMLKKAVEQIFKWSTGLVLGLSLVQNMILPAVDSLKSTLWQKGLSSIPGAGAVLSTLMGSFLGAGVLIKNSVGMGCLLVLLLLCVIPVIKLLLFMVSFYLCSAFLQPISDKRLMNLLYATGECGKMFLQLIVCCVTLLFITIALAAVSTNMRYYAG